MHEAYLCTSCFRNAICQDFDFMVKKGRLPEMVQLEDDQGDQDNQDDDDGDDE